MGQMTLAFTKQMLRVFNFVELEDPDHLVTNAWPSIPRSSETNCDLIATRSKDEQTQAIKHAKRNRARYYGHARKNKRDSRNYGREVIAFTLNEY
jgi:hypothetical protein